MEKLQLYEKVLNKMKQKKLLEERNRPHYEVFRLEAEIAYEGGQTLKLGIKELESNLAKENERLKRLKHSLRVDHE